MRCMLWITDPDSDFFSIRITEPNMWISDPLVKRQPVRADARRNYSHILAVAREVVTAHGVDASMRDIARRADV